LKIEELLGLVFFLIFVVGPILKDIFGRKEEALPAEEPLFEEAHPEETPLQEAPPAPAASKTRPAPPASEPAPAALSSQPAATEALPAKKRRKGRGQKAAKKQKPRLGRSAIVEGIVWHEILSEPKAKRRWPPKR